jgi:hypothetical protein
MSEGGYRLEQGNGLILDDRLWQLAIGVERHFQQVRQGQALTWTHDEQVLARMLHMGTLDLAPVHKGSNMSVRAMRYSAILSDRLWSMLQTERDRVRLVFDLGVRPLLICFDREIVSKEMLEL